MLLPGLLPEVPATTVKVNAKFPGTVPAIKGVVCLFDLATGSLLALLDSAWITTCRTGYAAALSTHLMAGPRTEVLGVIGAGAQAMTTVEALRLLRSFDHVVLHDIDQGRAAAAAGRWRQAGLECEVAGSASGVAAVADTVLTATWSREPLLDVGDVRPGTHITSLGADEPGKIELSRALLLDCRLVVDDLDLARSAGVLGTAGLPDSAVAATVGDLIAGVPGRTAPDETTVYSPVGLPCQDLALAWLAYRSAVARGIGTEFTFDER